MTAGYALHVEGCPLLFATANCPTATLPFAGVTQVDDSLDSPAGTISYQLNPVTGDLSAGQMSFLLHDFEYEGSPLVTHLCTRRPRDLELTALTATLSSDAMSFDVVSGAALGTLPRVVWIGTEAVLCQSVASNTVTVASGGRGYLGTRASQHSVDAETGALVPVYGALQRFRTRRVLLYRVAADGTADVVWRGYVTLGPRLSRDQVSIELQAEHVWTRYKSATLGRPDGVCTLRGYNMSGVDVSAYADNSPFYFTLDHGDVGGVSRNSLQEALNLVIDGTYQPSLPSVMIVAQDYGTRVTITAQQLFSSAHQPLSLSVQIGSSHARETYSGDSDTAQTVAVTIYNPPRAVIHTGSSSAGGGAVFPVDRVDQLPTSWAQRGRRYGAHVVQVAPYLIGDAGDYLLALYAASDSPLTQFDPDYAGPTFHGLATYVSKDPAKGVPIVPEWIERQVGLRQGYGIWATHWAYALREAVEDSVYLRSGINPDDWDFDHVDVVVAATEDQFSAVAWALDGTQKLEDLLGVTLPRSGTCLGVVDSRLALGAIAPPTASTTASAEIAISDLTLEPIQWEPLDAQIVNTARFQAPGVDVVVTDARSVEEYGLQSATTLRADGCLSAQDFASDPRALALHAASKTFFLWGRERETISLSLPADQAADAQIFSYVKVTLPIVPNAGAHGISDEWGQVIGRDESLDGAWVRLTILRWDLAPGYSPCVRAAEIQNNSGDGRGCLIAAVEYVGGTSDYAGSERADYAGTQGDGGVSGFRTDDEVRLQLIDVAAAYELNLTVDSVEPSSTPGMSKIYFTSTVSTSPIDWEAGVAAGAIVHLVHRDYYDGTGFARRWAWCGDDTTGEIDGGPDSNQEVSS